MSAIVNTNSSNIHDIEIAVQAFGFDGSPYNPHVEKCVVVCDTKFALLLIIRPSDGNIHISEVSLKNPITGLYVPLKGNDMVAIK